MSFNKILATEVAKTKGYTYFQYNGEDYFVDFNNRDSIRKAADYSGLNVFREEDDNLVLYDPIYYKEGAFGLLYIGDRITQPPQPVNLKSYHDLFLNNNSETLDLTSWDVSNATDMHTMFGNCRYLRELDVSTWNTSSVLDMSRMFTYCEHLKVLNVGSWDVSSVKDMQYMFESCRSLQVLDVASWDVSSVESMYAMFMGCADLINLDINFWNVSSVKDISWIFAGCNHLKDLDISSWDISSVETMAYMFRGCNSLPEIFRTDDIVKIIEWCEQNKGVDTINVF